MTWLSRSVHPSTRGFLPPLEVAFEQGMEFEVLHPLRGVEDVKA